MYWPQPTPTWKNCRHHRILQISETGSLFELLTAASSSSTASMEPPLLGGPPLFIVSVLLCLLLLLACCCCCCCVSLCRGWSPSQKGLIRTPDPRGENGFTFAHISASEMEIAERPSSRKNAGPCEESKTHVRGPKLKTNWVQSQMLLPTSTRKN